MTWKTKFWIELLTCMGCILPGLLAADTAAGGAPWQHPAAVLRFEIVVDSSPMPDTAASNATHVSVCPTGFNPEEMVSAAYDRRGTPLASRTLYARQGEPMTLLLAAATAGGQEDHGHDEADPSRRLLYLVPRAKSAEPAARDVAAGIMLETRTTRMPLRELSVSAFQDVWRRAETTNGTALVSAINHTGPVVPDRQPPPSRFAAYRPPGLWLNHYSGWFRVTSATGRLHAAHAAIKASTEKQAALNEQVKRAHFKLREAEYELAMARRYPDAVKVSPAILRQRLMRRSAEYDRVAKTRKGALARTMETASNTIAEVTSGHHTFFAGSRGGSHLLIDGQPTIHWPVEKPLNVYAGRYINLSEVTVPLRPGWHRLDFFHYAEADRYMATVAWRRPGEEQAHTMAEDDFLPVTRGSVAAASTPKDAMAPLLFAWHVEDDLRCPSAGDMVQMNFSVTVPRPDVIYEWDLGDGAQATGAHVSHLYFLPGAYEIILRERLPSQAAGGRFVRQAVHARAIWTKRNLADLAHYETFISEMDVTGIDVKLLLNAYAFAHATATDRQPLYAWRDTIRRALVPRLHTLEDDAAPLAVTLAQEAASPRLRRYDEAEAAYAFAVHRLPEGSAARIDAILSYADLQLNVHGAAAAALELLDALHGAPALSAPAHRRARILRAEALLANGQATEAARLLHALGARDSADPEATKRAIRQRAELRYARAWASEGNADFDTLTLAMDKVEALVAETPHLALSPEVNRIRLDALLGRREYRRAFHLANRLLNLPLDDVVRADIVSRRERAALQRDAPD